LGFCLHDVEMETEQTDYNGGHVLYKQLQQINDDNYSYDTMTPVVYVQFNSEVRKTRFKQN